MKDYNEYMDMITGDADLQAKIKEKIRMNSRKTIANKRKLGSRTKGALVAMGAVACAAALSALLLLPGLMHSPAVILPDAEPLGYVAPAYDNTDDPVAEYEAPEAHIYDIRDVYNTYNGVITPDGCEILFNPRDAVLDDYEICTQDWENFGSRYDLTNEQVAAAFPELDIPLWAWTIYCPDDNFLEMQGTFLTVYVAEIHDQCDETLAPVMTGARIRVSDRALTPRIQHRAPGANDMLTTTDILGVEVTAVIYSDTVHDPFFLRVSFEIDGVYYLVESGNTCWEEGMRMVEGIVHRLIASGAVDFGAVLP